MGYRICSAAKAGAALALGAILFCTGITQAQVLAPTGSGVKTVFASQSDGYQDSDPTGITFGPAGLGPYAPANTIPNAPTAPAPAISPAGGNAFSTNGGGGYTSTFNDLLGTTTFTAGQSTLDDIYLFSPLATSDMAIIIPALRLFQAPAAPGYAYLQSTFGSNYLITSNPGLAPNPSPNFPATISGSTAAPGNYAQFDAQVTYTWIPVNINSSGVITPAGSPTTLGTLSWTFSQTGGSYGTTILSTGGLLATPAGNGIMSLTGHAWLAGDPMNIDVSLAPEPSVGLGILACAGIAQMLWRRRARPLANC